MSELASLRLDKWLWSARFYKTRSLAVEEIGKGRVSVNGASAKPSRELRCGDTVELRQGPIHRTVVVLGLSAQRGPAQWPSSFTRKPPKASPRANRPRSSAALPPEPAASLQEGRPTKRDRRQIEANRDWNDRWSASI